MAEELVTFAIQKLWDLLSHENTQQFQGVENQVTELKTDLNILKSFMKDADTKKHKSARVRNCVEVIKEIIFDAEDIIETFILKDQLRKNGGIKKCMRILACIITEHRRIALEIGNLSKRISKVIHEMEAFGKSSLETLSASIGRLKHLETLTRLILIDCLLEEDPIPILENMLHLKKVELMRKSFCERKMVCSRSGFSQLQMLLFYGLKEWKECTVEEGSMPLLHTLQIHECNKLKELPDEL